MQKDRNSLERVSKESFNAVVDMFQLEEDSSV